MEKLRWVVIERPIKNAGDEFVTVCKDEAAARQLAQDKLDLLSFKDRKNFEIIAGSANVDENGNYKFKDGSYFIFDTDIREVVFDSKLKTLKEIIKDIEDIEFDENFVENIIIEFGDYEYKGVTEVIVSKDESNSNIDYQAYVNCADAPIICIEIRDGQIFNVWEG